MTIKNVVLFFALFVVSFGAFASTPPAIDVSSAVNSISTDATAAVSSIGVALLGLAGVAIAFKWAKAAIFG